MRWRPSRPNPPDAQDAPVRFEDVVLPHLDSAYNVARWLVGDPVLAEDVVQEAAVRALRHLGTYRGGNARAWLLRIVRNAAHDARATRARHAAAPLDGTGADAAVPDPGDDPEASLARQQDHSLLDRALASLPPDLRECLVLRELEELSYREIATVTGVPIGTVMSRLWRARQAVATYGAESRGAGDDGR